MCPDHLDFLKFYYTMQRTLCRLLVLRYRIVRLYTITTCIDKSAMLDKFSVLTSTVDVWRTEIEMSRMMSVV